MLLPPHPRRCQVARRVTLSERRTTRYQAGRKAYYSTVGRTVGRVECEPAQSFGVGSERARVTLSPPWERLDTELTPCWFPLAVQALPRRKPVVHTPCVHSENGVMDMHNTNEPRTLDWGTVGGEVAESVKRLESGEVLDLGRKIHGQPVMSAYGEVILWVESYQWMYLDDGSREPRRYRLVGRYTDSVDSEKGDAPYPFDQPGRVMEFGTEQEVRDLLTKRSYGRL